MTVRAWRDCPRWQIVIAGDVDNTALMLRRERPIFRPLRGSVFPAQYAAFRKPGGRRDNNFPQLNGRRNTSFQPHTGLIFAQKDSKER